MALTQKSWGAKTSGDTWTDVVAEAATVGALTLANTSFGKAVVSVRLLKGATPYVIVPPNEIDANGSSRLRLPGIVVAAGDKLQVKSIGAVDWTASGATV